jgi:multiple sugar transport system substrate-binding protein
MKNRSFLWLTIALLFSLFLVACGSPVEAPQSTTSTETDTTGDTTTETATTESSEAGATGEKAKVTIFVGLGTGTDPDQIAAQEALAEEFNTTHDDIEIEFLIVPVEEAPERLLAMVSGGNAPQLVGPNGISTVAQFFDLWADITPFIEAENFDLSDFYGPAVSLNQYPDKNTGLPLGLFPSFIFYNADLFDAAGVEYPPHDYDDTSWTLDVLREKALQMTLDANGNNALSPDFDPENIVQWGFDDSWTDARGLLTKFGAPNIGRPTTEDYRTAVVNSEEWAYGLEWVNNGVWVDHFIPDLAAQEARDAAGADPFGPGNTAMFYSHTWFMPEGLVDLPFAYDIAPLPFNQKGERIARVHADNFTMPEDAANKEEAWEVMKWLTSPEHIVDVCLIYGCLPARQSVQDEFGAALAERFPGLDYDVIFTAIDYLDNPNHESWVPEWGRVADVLNNNLGAVYVAPIEDPQALLDQTNTEIQAILDEYWASR